MIIKQKFFFFFLAGMKAIVKVSVYSKIVITFLKKIITVI